MNKSYIAISSDSLQGLELVSSLHNRAKNGLKMFAISCINFQLYIILITTSILKKQLKVQLLMCYNVYDNVTNFKVRGFTQNTKI